MRITFLARVDNVIFSPQTQVNSVVQSKNGHERSISCQDFGQGQKVYRFRCTYYHLKTADFLESKFFSV